jgi:ATP-dependent protease ClpP protease subunit
MEKFRENLKERADIEKAEAEKADIGNADNTDNVDDVNDADNTNNTNNTGTKETQDNVREMGQLTLDKNSAKHKIHLVSIIGEIEGHELAQNQTKTTKYEHILPMLAAVEDSDEIDGVLILLNTVGGDVEAGLAIAEMIASLSKPTVSLVLGGSHSIGVPLAVAADYSMIVPSGTMIIHPVRMNGMVIGVIQTYEYFERIQERILNFVTWHSGIDKDILKQLMLDTSKLAKDVGTILDGNEAVAFGLMDAVGGISDALKQLNRMIDIQAGKEDKKSENI